MMIIVCIGLLAGCRQGAQGEEPDDFAEIGCTGAYVLRGPYDNYDKPSRRLMLTFEPKTKQGVLDAVKTVLERMDVCYANADSWVKIYP